MSEERKYLGWNSPPWKRDGLTIYCGEKPNHVWIAAAITGGDHTGYPVDYANLQRAVDCVNAMDGIPDPQAFVEEALRLRQRCEELEKALRPFTLDNCCWEYDGMRPDEWLHGWALRADVIRSRELIKETTNDP